MFEIIIFLAVLASIISGISDLLTTEVPDQIPYAMVGSGILYWAYNWLSSGNIQLFSLSLFTGTLLLGLGLLMYKKGQWGAADAWVLAGIAYMIPVYNGYVFILPYLMNFVFVALGYVILYSLLVGFQNSRMVANNLKKDLVKNTMLLILTPVAVLLALVAASGYNSMVLNYWFAVPLSLIIVVFWRYAKVIENSVFTKKISTRNLRAGDVLQKNIWIGLTAREIKKLKSAKKYVTVKDGIRFVPVFTITLILTLLGFNLFTLFF
jgi:Flp pilus assembly protein protease CpaA